MIKKDAKLKLNRETVRQLDQSEMEQAAGGKVGTVLPTQCGCTGMYPSLNAPCGSALVCQ